MSDISVKVDGSGVTSGVRTIKRDLSSLNKDVKNTFSAFEQFNKGLKNIQSTSLDKVISGMSKFESGVKELSSVNYKALSSELEGFALSLELLSSVKLGSVSKEFTKLKTNVSSLDDVNFTKISTGMRELRVGLELLDKLNVGRVSGDLTSLSKNFGKLGRLDYAKLSKGLTDVRGNLKSISTLKLSKVAVDITKFSDSLSNIKGTNLAAQVKQLHTSTVALSKSLQEQSVLLSKTANTLDKYGSAANSAGKNTKRFNSNISSSISGIHLLTGAIASLTATLGIRELIQYSDSWKQITNLVRISVDTEKELVQVREKLFNLSLETRTELKAQTTLYNRLNIAQKDLGVTQTEILGVIRNVGLALGVTATSALESRGSLIQLSQAFGQGIVRAEEFNSIMEGTPKIARAIAKGLSVSTAQLRQLVLEGFITSKDVFVALQSQGSELRAEFDKVDKTIGQAMTNLRTNFTKAFGEFDEAAGLSNKLIQAIDKLSETLKTTDIASFAKDLKEAGEDMATVVAIIGGGRLAAGLVGGIASLAAGLGTATTGMQAFNVAINSNLVALTALAAVLGSKVIEDAFSRVFGDAAKEIDYLNKESLQTLEIRLNRISQASGKGDVNLLQRVLGANPVEVARAIKNVDKQVESLEGKLATLQEADKAGFFSRGAIEDTKKQISYLKDLLEVNKDFEAEVNKLKEAESKRIEVVAEAAAKEASIVKARQIAFVNERAELKQRLSLQKQARTLLEKLPETAGDAGATKQYDVVRQSLQRIIEDGDKAKIRVLELIKDEKQLVKILGTANKTEIESIKLLIPKLIEEGNQREKVLRAQVNQGERLKKLLPSIQEAANAGNEGAQDILEEMIKRIQAAEDAFDELARKGGSTPSGISDGFNKLLRDLKDVNDETKKLEKGLRELAKRKDQETKIRGLLPQLKEAESQGGTGATAVIDELEQQLINIEIEQQKLIANFGDIPADPFKDAIKSAKQYIKDQTKSIELTIKLKDLQYQFADSFEDFTFGNEAIDATLQSGIAVINMLDEQIKREENIKKLRQEAAAIEDVDLRAKAVAEADKAENDNIKFKLSGYKNLFGTISGLAKENSKEQKALHNLSQAFAIAEIAMKAKESVAAAVLAVAEAGSGGDPYTAIARVAAMAATMAGVLSIAGISFSGGGSGGGSSTPHGKQAATSGTVLGDKLASSESSTKTLELLDDIHADEYAELKNIVSEIQNLNKNITGLVSGIVRNFGSFSGEGIDSSKAVNPGFGYAQGRDLLGGMVETLQDTLFNMNLDPLSNLVSGLGLKIHDKIIGGLFGKVSTKLVDSGLIIGDTVIGDLISGVDASVESFQRIKIKKKSWFSSSTKYKTITDSVDASITDLFTDVFTNISESLVDLSASLGGDNLQQILDYKFEVGEISLKDKTGEEITKEINAVISTLTDQMAEDLLGELISQYQKVDEGLYETAVRLATEKEITLDILRRTNQAFDGSTRESIAFTQSIVGLAGGLEQLTESFSGYYNDFFSAADKQIDLTNSLTNTLERHNLTLPEAREGYKLLLEGVDLTTESGKKAYISLLNASESADEYYKYIEKLLTARQGLEITILELEGKAVEALAMSRRIELDALDESLRPLQERIYILEDEAKAADIANKLAEEAEDLRRKRQDLEIQILNLEGKSIEALTIIRQRDLDALDESLRPLQERIYALEDEATASEEAAKKLKESEEALEGFKTALDGLNLSSALEDITTKSLGGVSGERFTVKSETERSRIGLERLFNAGGISDASRDYALSLINATEEVKLAEISNKYLTDKTNELATSISNLEQKIENRSKSLTDVATTQAGILGVGDEFRSQQISKSLGRDVTTQSGKRSLLDDFIKSTPEDILNFSERMGVGVDQILSDMQFLNDSVGNANEAFRNIVSSVDDFRDSLSTSNVLLSPEQRLGAIRDSFKDTINNMLSGDPIVAAKAASKVSGVASEFLSISAETQADPKAFRDDFNEVARSLNRAEESANEQIKNNETIEKITKINWEIQHSSLDDQLKELKDQKEGQRELIDVTELARQRVEQLLNLQIEDGKNFNNMILHNLDGIIAAIDGLTSNLIHQEVSEPTLPMSFSTSTSSNDVGPDDVTKDVNELKVDNEKIKQYLFAIARDINKINTRQKGWDVNGLPEERP